MESSEIQRMISEGIPDAEVHVDGDGSHFIAKVICEKFSGNFLACRFSLG